MISEAWLAAAVLAAALVAWPENSARRRLRPRSAGFYPGLARRPAGVILAALALLIGAFWVGIAGLIAAMMVIATVGLRRRAGILRARTEEQSDALVGALDVLISQLQVGVHPGAACAFAAADCRGTSMEPVLTRAAAQAALGGSVADALAAESPVAELFGSQSPVVERPRATFRGSATTRFHDLARVASVWALAERHGIAMGEMLEVVRRDLLERAGFRRRVAAGLAGARATAAVLALLPLVGVGLGQLMGAAPLRVLLGGGVGGMLLVAGVFLDCAGLLWADRIAQVGIQ